MTEHRSLRVFLCHASQDKPAVRGLYQRLKSEAWIDAWLDEEKLLGGQDFDLEIYKATRDADAIIICLSKISVTKEGYVNKEIRRALDIAQEKPEGAIYVIPLRLDECIPTFERLKQLQWVDYFTPDAHERLLKSLSARAQTLGIETTKPDAQPKPLALSKGDDADFYKFEPIDNPSIAYPLWFAKYPVTNRQYERFLKADDFASEEYWKNFPKYDEACKLIGAWQDEGWNWLKEQLKDYAYFPRSQWKVEPRYWDYSEFGIAQPHNPVVGVTWYEANAYCKWLARNWQTQPEAQVNSAIFTSHSSLTFRLLLEMEWTVAAGGNHPEGRYPWDKPGKVTTDENEIKRRANVARNIGHTTPVNQYPEGKSPYGLMDMSGNVWEWQANYYHKESDYPSLRGGSWIVHADSARASVRHGYHPDGRDNLVGFRVVVCALPSG
jgi:formylglycine-generating enzyme required for sulfatase activity